MRNLTFPHSIIDAKIAVNECPCYAVIIDPEVLLEELVLVALYLSPSCGVC
jgi:hypothetical protein